MRLEAQRDAPSVEKMVSNSLRQTLGCPLPAIDDVLREIFSCLPVVWRTEEEDRGAECR